MTKNGGGISGRESEAPLIQVEHSSAVVPQELALALRGDRLFKHLLDAPWERAVGMRIVGVPRKIVVADQFDRRLHRGLVAAKRHADVALEILSRALGEVLMLGVAAVLPMLLHALQPVWNPSAVSLDMDHLQVRQFLEYAEPDKARHRSHRLKRMREDVAANVRVHPVTERRHRRGGRLMGRDRLADLL